MKIRIPFLRSRLLRCGFSAVLVMIFLLPLFVPLSTVMAQSGSVGYRAFSFPDGLGGARRGPTGEKPESKLWWVDGVWYGSLWSTSANAYTIHRYNLSSNNWTNTSVKIDDRFTSKADALWDGTRLYIVSHMYIENAGAAAPAGQRGELYRYSYNASAKTFSLDSGFPVEVNGAITETLVIDKDSSGTLWVTYVENRKVMVNHTLNGDDHSWGTPFILPAGGMETVNKDDISSIVAYNNHVGIMWSRQTSPQTMYFAVHPIGAPDSTWTRVRSFTAGDDHINLKTLQTDSAGNVFAVIKTNNNASLIMVLVCKNNINRCKNESDWSAYTAWNANSGEATRPILMIDESNRHLYVFARSEPTGTTRGSIYYKRANLSSISFNASEIGTLFISNSLDFQVDDVTSTKQNVNSAMGLLILASDPHTNYYLHNYIALGGPAPTPPTISGFTPTSGPAGTEVTVSGANFNGVSSVTFNNSPAQSFTVDSASSLRAVVPAGATTGQIQVITPAGTATSSGSFTVTTVTPVPTTATPTPTPTTATPTPITPTPTTPVPTYTLNVTVQGSGTVSLSPAGGSYSAGTIVNLTAAPAQGWVFSGWQGDLAGSANPAAVTMDANKNITAVFTQQSSGGTVTYQGSVTGSALAASAVSTSVGAGGAGASSLYLAAVASRNSTTVSSVSGLGLTWTLVTRQCAGRNQTMVEVWMAQGTPAADGPVTAQFSAAIKSAVITVSRYTGAASLGLPAGANTMGLNGACAGGVDSASYAFDLSTTTPGGVIYSAASMRNRTHTPGAGYTERTEIAAGSSGDISSIAVQDMTAASPATVPVSGAFSGTTDWAVVALEIRP